MFQHCLEQRNLESWQCGLPSWHHGPQVWSNPGDARFTRGLGFGLLLLSDVQYWSHSCLIASLTWETKLLLWPPLAGDCKQRERKGNRWFQDASLFSATILLRMVASLFAEDSRDPCGILCRILGFGKPGLSTWGWEGLLLVERVAWESLPGQIMEVSQPPDSDLWLAHGYVCCHPIWETWLGDTHHIKRWRWICHLNN